MNRVMMIAALLAGTVPALALAQAQTADTAARTLGACLVEKSTGGDRIAMMRWMATAILAAPQLTDLASVTAAAREKADRGAAEVWTRLLTVDCFSQAQAVTKDNPAIGFRVAGESLGRVAMQELMTSPQTQQSMNGFAQYVDKEAMKKLTAK